VQRWVVRWRDADPGSGRSGCAGAAWKTPGKRRAAWLVVAEAETLDATERRFVEALLAASSDLAGVVELARRFRAMIRERQETALDPWLAAAKGTALAGFAAGLASTCCVPACSKPRERDRLHRERGRTKILMSPDHPGCGALGA
jgi:hypothetical protein